MLVLLNVATEADIANGTRGTIVDILLGQFKNRQSLHKLYSAVKIADVSVLRIPDL